jgi:hypothetical protein
VHVFIVALKIGMAIERNAFAVVEAGFFETLELP